MRANAVDAVGVEEAQGVDQPRRLDNWDLEHGAHGTADGAAKVRGTGGFTDHEGLHLKSGAVPDEGADVLRTG